VHYGLWANTPKYLPKNPFKGHRTKICALQSLFYKVPDVSLVKDDESFERLRKHFQIVVDLASANGIPCVIFGSPGVRSNRDFNLSYQALLERISFLAEYAFSRNVKLCFEVNSPKFGCEFLTTNQSLFDLHSDLDHPGLGLHLDVGQMIEEGLNPIKMVSTLNQRICHLHLSSPDFTFQPTMFDLYQSLIKKLASQDIDIILEIQTLGGLPECRLVDFFRKLNEL
jgi:sugar phosphate isomerase/epimerase